MGQIVMMDQYWYWLCLHSEIHLIGCRLLRNHRYLDWWGGCLRHCWNVFHDVMINLSYHCRLWYCGHFENLNQIQLDLMMGGMVDLLFLWWNRSVVGDRICMNIGLWRSLDRVWRCWFRWILLRRSQGHRRRLIGLYSLGIGCHCVGTMILVHWDWYLFLVWDWRRCFLLGNIDQVEGFDRFQWWSQIGIDRNHIDFHCCQCTVIW